MENERYIYACFCYRYWGEKTEFQPPLFYVWVNPIDKLLAKRNIDVKGK